MKLIYLFFFLLFLSCNTIKKEYVCGNHLCIDKKEFNEYFSKNFTVEIKAQKIRNKEKKLNLVNLNSISLNEKKIDNKNSKKKERIKKKKEKRILKAEKIRLLEERKIKEIKERNRKKQDTKTAKLTKSKDNTKKNAVNEISNNHTEEKSISKNIVLQEKNRKKSLKENISIISVETIDMKSLCDEIKDCDIDKIAELLIKKGKNKPYPNVSSN